MISDPTLAVFNEMVFGKRSPRPTVEGPQEAKIVSVDGSTCYVTIPALSKSYKYGPAQFLPGLQLQAGDDCLVIFLGSGVKKLWVVSGGQMPVTSVFGRTGAVVAETGDYTASEVTHAADLSATAAQVFAGEVEAPSVAASAAGTGRYMGATDGAPTYASPEVGDFANDPTNSCFWLYNGSVWEQVGNTPWTDWTPTFSTTGGGSPTFGNGTVTARYALDGKMCTVRFLFVYGTTSNGGLGPWEIGLPFAARNDVEQHLSCKVYTGATGQDWYGGGLIQAGTNFVLPEAPISSSTSVMTFVQNTDGGGGTGAGVPLVTGAYTFNSGSNVAIYGTYEIA